MYKVEVKGFKVDVQQDALQAITKASIHNLHALVTMHGNTERVTLHNRTSIMNINSPNTVWGGGGWWCMQCGEQAIVMLNMEETLQLLYY